MKNYETYLFDLDGTLINTIDLILECFRNSLDYAAGIVVDPSEIRKHVGLPLKEQFQVYLTGISDIDYDDLMQYHMDYQIKIWKDYLFLYDGVIDTLTSLQNLGKKLAIVTSRRKMTTDLYTSELCLAPFFSLTVTPESTGKHKPDPAPALFAMEQLNSKKESSLFIGDATFDIDCGKNAGIDTCFASWGARESLPDGYSPTYSIDKMDDLLIF